MLRKAIKGKADMRKLVIAVAVATTVSASAQAAITYNVDSDITGAGLFLGLNNLVQPTFLDGSPIDVRLLDGSPVSFSVAIGGTATDSNDDGIIDTTNLTFDGYMEFLLSSDNKDIYVDFHLSSGGASAAGTLFTGGGIEVFQRSVPGGAYSLSGGIDATVTPLSFESSISGGHFGQPTAGVTIAAPGVTSLPGVWNGIILNSLEQFFRDGVTVIPVLDYTAAIYLGGTVTLTAVPVPAAAWLFGSALIGLVGLKRKKQQ